MTKRILVVEDDPSVGPWLAKLLRKEGYDACLAQSPEAAAAGVAEAVPDLAVVDAVLGKDNGWEVARWLSGRTKAPVIMMTGATVDANVRADARVLGARAMLQKPFEAEELLTAVRAALK